MGSRIGVSREVEEGVKICRSEGRGVIGNSGRERSKTLKGEGLRVSY